MQWQVVYNKKAMQNAAVDYGSLVKNGLQLPENDFNLIRDSLFKGCEEVKKYLGVENDPWPKFDFSNDIPVLGFYSKDDSICISVNNLNQQSSRSTPLEYKDQLIVFMPDVFYIITKYLYWLKLFGREATIHRYQKLGNPKLHVPFPESLPASFSAKLLLLSNIEVEARTISDAVAKEHEEVPIWENVNAYLSKNYADYYNKSLEDLAKLPKPHFPISFEMEYYTV